MATKTMEEERERERERERMRNVIDVKCEGMDSFKAKKYHKDFLRFLSVNK